MKLNSAGKYILSQSVMNENKITLANLESNVPLNLGIGSTVMFDGMEYKINEVPAVSASNTYVHSAIFEAPEYDLYNKMVMHEGVGDFPYYGSLADHVNLILENINEINPGWSGGSIAATSEMFVSYENISCRAAIFLLAKTFSMEYSFTGKTINMAPTVGTASGRSFEYGYHKGLYRLTQTASNSRSVQTRVYAFGSEKNIPTDYREGSRRLKIEGEYVDSNTGIYGVREGVFTDESIFPTRTGGLTEVVTVMADNLKYCTVKDSTINFDINDHLLGSPAKISFTSGELYGETFEIVNYNHATKSIKFKTILNSSNVRLPSTAFSPAVGDSYVLLDISLPEEYVVEAEERLLSAAQNYIYANSIPNVQYQLELDPLYAKTNGILLKAGEIVNITHVGLGIINVGMRVVSVNYPIDYLEYIDNQTKITAVLANFISPGMEERLVSAVIDNRAQISEVKRNNAEDLRNSQNSLRDLQLMVFDPDDYFDMGNIRPLSIETLLLSVGAKSQRFNLRDVLFSINHEGNQNNVYISGGTLEHMEIDIPGVGNKWVIPEKLFLALDPTKPYYIYAKCSNEALTGEWMLSEVPVYTEETDGFFNFNVGIVYKVRDGVRGHDLTYGNTTIVGEYITTGIIQDITKQNYLNIKTGQFNLGPAYGRGMDWDVSNPGNLTIRGGLIQNGGGITALIPVFRGGYSNVTTYYPGDTVTYLGSLWRWIYPVASFNVTPAEGAYWTLEVSKGDTGPEGKFTEYRFAENGSPTVPPALVNTENEPVGWDLEQPEVTPGQYVWVISAKKTGEGILIGTWSTQLRFNGAKGDDGAEGPSLLGYGNYDNTKTYSGTPQIIQAVLYAGNWYTTRVDAGSFSGVLPTNTSKWNPFAGQFESVATDILFATLAFIKNLGVENLRTNVPGNKRIEILSEENNIVMYNAADQAIAALDDDAALTDDIFELPEPGLLPRPKNFKRIKPGSGGTIGEYYVLGPGLSIGKSWTDSGGFASIGPKGIATTGRVTAKMFYNNEGDLTIECANQVIIKGNGGIVINGRLHVYDGATLRPTIDYESDVRMGGGDFWRMRWVNGALVSAVNLGP